MKNYPNCNFLQLEHAFCKRYYNVQNGEQVYM